MLTDCCYADFIFTSDHVDILALRCSVQILLDLYVTGSAGVKYGISDG